MAAVGSPAPPKTLTTQAAQTFWREGNESIAMLLSTPGLTKTKNGRADPLPFCDLAFCQNYFLFTAFLSSAPGLNFATLRAAILIVAPVCGLRPFRAFLCDTEKVPKPINATRSPFRNAPVMLLTVVSIAVAACALLISHAPAILSTRSALFIVSLLAGLFHTQQQTRKIGACD